VTAQSHRHAGRRGEAWEAIKEGRRRAAAMLEITAYTIRHTVAAEMRKRSVPVWEVAGFLGHTSGYKTTERYSKFGPDRLGGAIRAIDAYFADLGIGSAALHLRVSSVSASSGPSLQLVGKLVEPTGIEPVTSTMPL
jgi:hypothetical protein